MSVYVTFKQHFHLIWTGFFFNHNFDSNWKHIYYVLLLICGNPAINHKNILSEERLRHSKVEVKCHQTGRIKDTCAMKTAA